MRKKKMRGYIFSRSFFGERVPQHIQNIILKDYCDKNNFEFLLSSTEYIKDNCHMMLKQVLKEIKSIDGILAYSLFQLPIDNKEREKLYKKILSEKKEIHFCVENLKISNISEVEKIENIWQIKKILPKCPKNLN